jgi:hypothetical protein
VTPTLDLDGYPLDPYNQVIPGLAQASSWISPGELLAEHDFDASVDVGGWDQSSTVRGKNYTFYLLDDVPWIPDPDAIHMLGIKVASMVSGRKPVVVNCAAGLNRSGFVVGRALIALGHQPAEAIELIRAARGPRALFNRTFEAFLLERCSPRNTSPDEGVRKRGDPRVAGPHEVRRVPTV